MYTNGSQEGNPHPHDDEHTPEGGRGRRLETDFVAGKIFLGGLDSKTTSNTVMEYVAQWGEVKDLQVMEARGFGFVTYADFRSAQQFLDQRDHQIDGRRIDAKAAVPRNSGSGSQLTRKMFVGGTGEITDEAFRAHFEPYGIIDDCVILRDKLDGSSRGFGFVTFREELSVEKCLVEPHFLNGRQVELKRAIEKEKMAAVVASGAPVRTGKANADWTCPECNNRNFGWREMCNRCKVQKPGGTQPMYAQPMAAGGYGGMPMMYGAPMGGMPMGGAPMGGMPMGMMQPGMPMAPMVPMMPGGYAPSAWMPAHGMQPMQQMHHMSPQQGGTMAPQQAQGGYGPMRHDRKPQAKPNPY